MADYAPDFTIRYKTRYRAGNHSHDITVRGPVDATPDNTQIQALADGLTAFFAALASQLYADFEFLSASYCATNSEIFIPTSILPVSPTGLIVVANFSEMSHVTASCMSGRSALAKARVYFYGLSVFAEAGGVAGGDGQLLVSEVAGIAGAKAAADGVFKAGDGQTATFYPRLTYKVNDRNLRAVRRGF